MSFIHDYKAYNLIYLTVNMMLYTIYISGFQMVTTNNTTLYKQNIGLLLYKLKFFIKYKIYI